MKTRVLHIMQSLEPGGLENGVVNVANFIDTDRFEIHIYCIKELGQFSKRITNSQTEVYLCEREKGLLKIAWDICDYCKKKNVDIVHTHGWGTFLVGVIGARMSRLPVINGEHGVLYDQTLKRRIAQYLLYNNVDANLSVSEELVSDISKRFSVRKELFKTIHNGIDLDKFHPDNLAVIKKREELGIDPEALIVGTVGRLDPIKHFHILISAFASFCNDHPGIDSKLLVVGEGIEKDRLQLLANELGISDKVMLLGHRDDIPELLNVMDLFVLTSESEGLSNTIMEAMACGVPVLATDVGGNRELVVSGETGRLFPVDNVEILAKELSSLSMDKTKREFFSENSIERIKKEFSIEVMVRKYEIFYSSLLKTGEHQ